MKAKKPVRDLRKEEVLKMLEIAKSQNHLHWLLLCLLTYGGFRQGEIVSTHTKDASLPGLQIEDLQDEGIWVQGKGGYRDFQPLQTWLVAELRSFIGKRIQGPIIHFNSHGAMHYIVQRYARLAGISDWPLIHPHSFRHFYGTQQSKFTGRDPWKVRDMCRHRTLASTTRYVGRLDISERKELAERMNEIV